MRAGIKVSIGLNGLFTARADGRTRRIVSVLSGSEGEKAVDEFGMGDWINDTFAFACCSATSKRMPVYKVENV